MRLSKVQVRSGDRRWECARERADKAGRQPNLNALWKREVRIWSQSPPPSSKNKLSAAPWVEKTPEWDRKQNRRTCKQSQSTLAFYNQQDEREETQCQTRGFNRGDHCPLGGPLHKLLKNCLSAEAPSKPPANTCQNRFFWASRTGHKIQESK